MDGGRIVLAGQASHLLDDSRVKETYLGGHSLHSPDAHNEVAS
jgi:ABC-type lipopolysaccharide export system ATPase subunit